MLATTPDRDPYTDQMLQRVIGRTPLGFGVFLGCLALSALFEMLHFPDRRGWMAAFAVGFLALVAVAWEALRRRPAWTLPVLVSFVNVVGVALNAYHAIVGASLASCVWVLTGLVASAAVILPWGSRNQALACVGTLASYPLHLTAATADPLTWGAGGTYLAVAVSLSVFGASRFARYLRSELELGAALSEREARLRTYFDLSLVGTAILAPDGTCTEVNDELCRMLGYTRGELLGLSWRTFVHPGDRAPFATLLRRMLSGSSAPERRDARCVRKGGATLDALISVRGLPGLQGGTDHVMMLVQDITERKQAEIERQRYLERTEAARERAEEASRAKDEFLATVSHELRTPLTPILAWSSMLRTGELATDKTAVALGAIEQSARTQAQLIDDLLDVSRIVSGEWRVTRGPMEVAESVDAAVGLILPAAEARGVRLRISLPETRVPVLGDPDRLQQVITNLVSNAVKFTPPGGHVDVTLERAETRARIVVRDTGEGIDPGFLPHVFERFRQADSSVTRRHGGLGLGLAIVRTLVELHGGTVRADSAGKGRGAAFTVEIPLAVDVESTIEGGSGRPPVRGTSLGGLHVLVVDDDPGSNAVVSAVLASRGVEVRTASSTPEALEIAGRWTPHVLVSDIAMPGEDGYALLEKLRARERDLGHVPAIALTAYTGTAERLRLLAAGFETHLAKPFDPSELAAAVEEAASRARPPT